MASGTGWFDSLFPSWNGPSPSRQATGPDQRRHLHVQMQQQQQQQEDREAVERKLEQAIDVMEERLRIKEEEEAHYSQQVERYLREHDTVRAKLQLKKKKSVQVDVCRIQLKIDNLQIALSKVRQQEEDRLTKSALISASYVMKDSHAESALEDTQKMMDDIADNFHDVNEASEVLSKDLSIDSIADPHLFDDDVLERELEAEMNALGADNKNPRQQVQQREEEEEVEEDSELEHLKASMPSVPKRAFAVPTSSPTTTTITTTTATTATAVIPSNRRAVSIATPVSSSSSVDYLQAASDALFK